ncbi:MmpS family transport accessory protein [Streptomyces sp. NPDC048521]|uniref:MmpS family transport accessory protein n=1 Tax=Streptomyces sp. NPDC048521 TaxID=3365566 RepID=UPI00371D0437
MRTQTAASTENPDIDDTAAAPVTRRRLRPLVFGGALLCVATAGALFATHDTNDENGAGARHHSPTVPVAYHVTGHGTAQINYAGPDGKLHTVNAHLPWHSNANMTTGAHAAVSIVLGREGGNAACSVSMHGKMVQHATAYGSYGRANCATGAGG